MSPSNFDILRAEYPEYAAEWEALRWWFDRNRQKLYVELKVLTNALKGRVGPASVINAVRIMISRGMLAVAYRVRSPAGDLLEGEFDEPSNIPDELWDRDCSRKIPTDDGELVSGYRWGSSDAH